MDLTVNSICSKHLITSTVSYAVGNEAVSIIHGVRPAVGRPVAPSVRH